jgi:Protein phosphatase 2C
MWRVAGASVVGTSHQRNGLPCQDYSEFLRCEVGGEPALVIAIADGAGSAAFSHLGAREAVGFLLRQAALFPRGVADIGREVAESWFAGALEHLQTVAEREKIEAGGLDCTALVAVLGERHAVFAQLGDGAWIAGANGTLGAVTWPYKGEFANETVFLTSPDARNLIQFQEFDEPLIAVAGFTDGIEAMALNFGAKTVHTPFFTRMFGDLQRCDDETSLVSPFISFLSSERVNERTDDDKTLVLACRVPDNSTGNEFL